MLNVRTHMRYVIPLVFVVLSLGVLGLYLIAPEDGPERPGRLILQDQSVPSGRSDRSDWATWSERPARSGRPSSMEYTNRSGTGISAESFTTAPFSSLEEASARFDLDERLLSLDTLGPVSSILISQDGDLIGEQYYGNMYAGRAHNYKSASKSILSILVGIAIDKGYLEGVDQSIGEFFPEYFDGNPDSLKAAITIEDLLTMRSGLASTSRSNYGRWVTSNNWILHALNRPLAGTPGQDRIYSTGNTHLLSVMLSWASGMSTLRFANRYLFEPMDIRISGWDRDPQGNYLGGNNMALRPRDMIKIGQLMMDVGRYEGEQLVSKEWIMQSVEPVTGRGGRINYGYLWFRRMSGDIHNVYAFGNGGQYLMILPELFAVLDREIIPFLKYRYRWDRDFGPVKSTPVLRVQGDFPGWTGS